MEFLSTTSLANEWDIAPNELFTKLKSLGLIDRKNNKWILTQEGIRLGGKTKSDPRFGDYVVWPENLQVETQSKKESNRLLNPTAIGQHFGVSSQKINLILSELGLVVKDNQGWNVTKLGKSLGGKQKVDDYNRAYVLWSPAILTNKNIQSVFEISPSEQVEQSEDLYSSGDNFRDKYPAKFRTADGHRVRSKSEMIIDDWFYYRGVVHSYEKKVPIAENVISDFYLPVGQGRTDSVWIEFWGLYNDPGYQERMKQKKEAYKKNNLILVELTEADILSIDDVLPVKLRPYKFDFK